VVGTRVVVIFEPVVVVGTRVVVVVGPLIPRDPRPITLWCTSANASSNEGKRIVRGDSDSEKDWSTDLTSEKDTERL